MGFQRDANQEKCRSRGKNCARDYCAHKAVAWRKCCWNKAPFASHYCHGARHAYALCQYDDYLQRMKEFEREKRLLQRKFRKEKANA
uniref:NADH dehydrogenase [ubiquinone] 1 beta subcomplex subunit 7 n=1 Tax=Globodera pallida TaxID=36090 RepID=A0A183CDP6_GLOPA